MSLTIVEQLILVEIDEKVGAMTTKREFYHVRLDFGADTLRFVGDLRALALSGKVSLDQPR